MSTTASRGQRSCARWLQGLLVAHGTGWACPITKPLYTRTQVGDLVQVHSRTAASESCSASCKRLHSSVQIGHLSGKQPLPSTWPMRMAGTHAMLPPFEESGGNTGPVLMLELAVASASIYPGFVDKTLPGFWGPPR
jgi:hypothetical protein